MDTRLRLSGHQHDRLKGHLFPGDGKEAVALLLCGQRRGEDSHVLTAYEVEPVPYERCSVRQPDGVKWPTSFLMPLLQRANEEDLAVVKIHSHPTGYEEFSELDDQADRDLFPSVHGWVDRPGPHGSAVMLPTGRIFARTVSEEGTFHPISMVSVAGDDLRFYAPETSASNIPSFTTRHAQAFGRGTTEALQRLSIGVVGCSGTGSPVIEQLARLGAGRLVLVDPDRIEEKNLNRIIHAGRADIGRPKAEVLAEAVRQMGLGTEIESIARDLLEQEVAERIAGCDVVFGCMDSISGRDRLNRIAAHYLIPYFDLGVRLDADGEGGIEQICGTVHYLQPGGSSLMSRKVYTPDQLRADSLRRADPEAYQNELEEGYVRGVAEDRPAVISVNMQLASLAVNEFLARVHPYRLDPNGSYAVHGVSLTQGRFYREEDGDPCPVLGPRAGRGDTQPFLGQPSSPKPQAA